MALIVFHVQDPGGQPIGGASLVARCATLGSWSGTTNPCGDFFADLGAAHYDLTVSAPGFADRVLPADLADPGVVTIGLDRERPSHAPGRDAVCSVRLTFQGLTVRTVQYGYLPWFEAALTSLTPADRQAVYEAKRQAGDTHCIVAWTWRYAEPGQPYADVPGADLTGDIAAYLAIVFEVLQAGFVPLLVLGGDGEGAGPGYNDPVGWTYGYQWLMDHGPELVHRLADSGLIPDVLLVPGWDGVFYGWEPAKEKIPAFAKMVRDIAPAAHIGIEFNVGHIPIGGGAPDYARGGPMQGYDVILGEFNGWAGTSTPPGDQVWQVVARLVSPYHRPPDQPLGDDPHPPFYLAEGTARGPFYFSAFEYDAYRWVRSQVSANEVQRERQYFTDLGARWTG